MNNIIKDWKLYLSSFLLVVFFASLPWVVFNFIALHLSIDFMYLIFYYLAFFILFLAFLVLFFFGFGKEKIKSRKTFLIYFSVLFLTTLYIIAYWLGWIIDSIFHAPNFMSI